MIYHQLCHSAINTDILASDESCLVRAQEKYHIGYVHRISDTTATFCCSLFLISVLRIVTSIFPSVNFYVLYLIIMVTTHLCQSNSEKLSSDKPLNKYELSTKFMIDSSYEKIHASCC